jgi:hypothetical protein
VLAKSIVVVLPDVAPAVTVMPPVDVI